MAAQGVARNMRQEQKAEREWLSALVDLSCMRLQKQEVVVFEIGICSAQLHGDLADMKLKLKFRMNGVTHLKSSAGKASIGADDRLEINFDSIGGNAIFGGGELLHFELCRACLLRSSQTLASCAVPAMTVLTPNRPLFGNGLGQTESSTCLNLEFVDLDTPDKVIANITMQIGFRITTLDDAGGFRMLKSPSLKLPAAPRDVSRFSTLHWAEERGQILNFCRKADRVSEKLQEVHGASMVAIPSFHKVPLMSIKEVEVDDDVSTSCESAGKSVESL